jgi:BirA family biotin operon repressor/biotin-[acetyl-CoA-carboxylase] ligase
MSTRRDVLKLLSDGKFHSGAQMGAHLGVTRAAVNKAVAGLAQKGLTLERRVGKGYRLEAPLELLDEKKILKTLAARKLSLHGKFSLLEETDSTSRALLDSLDRMESGSVCVAESQPRGRGRRGRAWVATPYYNLMLSIAWLFAQGASTLAGLSLATGVALFEALAEVGITGHALKWPNDVLFDNKKLAGILIDVHGESNGPTWAVLGVGVNGFIGAKDAKKIDQPWTDLASILQRPVSRNLLAAALIEKLYRTLQDFEKKGFELFRARWQALHAYHEKEVHLTMGDTQTSGTVDGVDGNGALRLRGRDGQVRVFHSGDVSLRAP